MSTSEEGYRKFKVVFQSIILLLGITLIVAYISGMGEMERGLLYLVLGILFTLESIFVLYKNLKQKHSH
ncbi:hypothetical protein KO561_11875 [Radiobacillus kanasensis]|uniref:hypothetical protein n=1 Tax=Radiobacillus kanasensis TaxID=2844358 RepID=UPI001E2F99CA|nr:hypothetical protein [Radiobacillus kanasensis]UFT97907.1 hypothetical protein KO561_11875 [Radiobacillus kanasensis]